MNCSCFFNISVKILKQVHPRLLLLVYEEDSGFPGLRPQHLLHQL